MYVWSMIESMPFCVCVYVCVCVCVLIVSEKDEGYRRRLLTTAL